MKQAIAGVASSQTHEVTVTIEWPTIAATGLGRFLGRLYAIQAGFWIFTLGRLFMGLSLPIGLFLFFWMLAPGIARRYRLTNRRIIVERGPSVGDFFRRRIGSKPNQPPLWRPEQYVDLNRFDNITIDVRPGQAWYPAGDLVFKLGNVETLRLIGVGHPDVFRAICMKANQAFVGVRKAVAAV
jgi:hypothetical protein